MKKFLSLVVLVCILASMCTVSAFAATTVTDEAGLRDAIAAGDDIVLGNDIEIHNSGSGNWGLQIEKAVNIDGNGKKLTYSGNSYDERAININTSAPVSISNVTIDASGVARAINIINVGANLTLSGVCANAYNYAVNVAGSSTGSVINISGGVYTGLNVLNIHGPNTTINASNAYLTTNDSTTAEGYYTIDVGYDAPGSKINLTGCKVTYNNIKGDSSIGNTFNSQIGSVDNVLTDNGNTYTLINNGISSDFSPHTVESKVAIDYGNDTYYSFKSLAAAINFASSGNTIRLMQDIDLGGQKIPVNKSITIDADGYKITNGTFVVDPSVASTFGITGLGNPEQLQQLLSGQLPAGGAPAPVPGVPAADPNPYGVPSTGSERDTALMIVLAVISGSVLLFSFRRKREA